MKILAAIYRGFCIAQETIIAVFVAAITFLVFISAIARGFNHPLNWAPDIALLLLAWLVFLGADAALRRADFIRVDTLMRHFPAKIQKLLYYVFYIMIIMFLALIVRFGIPLSIDNYRRTFQALQISYMWATLSAPAGAAAMIVTIIIKLAKKWKEDEIKSEGKEAF
jgi:TRAP-type C4-dicarboxylate transport system permease small subunit